MCYYHKVKWTDTKNEKLLSSLIIHRIGLGHVSSQNYETVTFLHEIQNDIDTSYPPFSSSPVPMVAPGNVRVNVVNSTLAEVHWDPVPLKSIRGHLQGYRASERHFSCSFLRTCPSKWKACQIHFSWLEEALRVHLASHLCSIPARVRSKSHCSQSERKVLSTLIPHVI